MEVNPASRLRLVPPKPSPSWRPLPGDRVEARSNDLWWEGRIERHHATKVGWRAPLRTTVRGARWSLTNR